MHHVDLQPGNDIIDGGDGADTIFGDDAVFYSPLVTGLTEIEKASQELTFEMNAILHALHHFALDYDLFEHTMEGLKSRMTSCMGATSSTVAKATT